MVVYDAFDLFQIISNLQETLDVARLRKNAFTRTRSMTFAHALSFMLDMRKTTLQTRLNFYFRIGNCEMKNFYFSR